MICPKCGAETATDECSGCGIIISRFNKAKEREAAAQSAASKCPSCGTPTSGKLHCRACGVNMAGYVATQNKPSNHNISKAISSGKAQICSSCGHVGNPKKVVKGSILIELFLWLCFLLPGLFYSIWRLTSKHMACPECGSQNMIPISSPMGQKLLRDLA